MKVTVGHAIAAFLERCGVKCAFGVISIHNMPILDAIAARGAIRFVSARGEAGATSMADACARTTQSLGVCITSTGTAAGNAAGGMVEALTAGTPLLHITGQIETPYLDRDLAYIHEAPDQLTMLEAVSKQAWRVRSADTALATFKQAVHCALTRAERAGQRRNADRHPGRADRDARRPGAAARGAGGARRARRRQAGRCARTSQAPAAVARRRRARRVGCGAAPGGDGLRRRHHGAGPRHRSPKTTRCRSAPTTCSRLSRVSTRPATRCSSSARACAATRR